MAPSVKAQMKAQKAERAIAEEVVPERAKMQAEREVKPAPDIRKEQAKSDRAGVKVSLKPITNEAHLMLGPA